MTLLLQTKSLTTTTKKYVPLTPTTKVVFLSSTRWPLEIFFWGYERSCTQSINCHRTRGTSGMYLIEVDAHQVDSNPAPLPLQTSEMLAIFFLTFSLSIQSVSMWTTTQSSQVCTLFDTLWFFTFESQPQVKRLSFPCQLRLLTKSVWEVSLKLKNEDLKKNKNILS